MGEIFRRVVPDTPLEWTGERLTTATAGQVEIEHLHRYFLARALCRGRDVLDVASGEGYGTALLAQTALSVIGVEVSAEAVAHAAEAYRQPNLRFLEGDARRLPLDDASVDTVVSFETIEHLYEHDQFLTEVRRVLRPGGRFIISSPERDIYSPSGSSANPYHVRELTRAEFSALLRDSFAHVRLLGQRPMLGSVLLSEGNGTSQSLTFEKRGPCHFEAAGGLPRPVYLVAVASDQPVTDVPDSLYIETAEIGTVMAAANAADAATAELDISAAGVVALEGELHGSRAEVARQSESIESLQQDLMTARAAVDTSVARAVALERELHASRAEVARQTESIASLQQDLMTARAAVDTSVARAVALESELHAGRGEVARQTESIASLQQDLITARADMARHVDLAVAGQQERVVLRAEAARRVDEAERLRREIAMLRTEIARQPEVTAAVEQELAAARADTARHAERAAALQRELDAARTETARQLAAVDAARATADAVSQRIAALEDELTRTRGQVSAALAQRERATLLLREQLATTAALRRELAEPRDKT